MDADKRLPTEKVPDPAKTVGRAAALVGVKPDPERSDCMVSVRVPQVLADQVKAAAETEGVSVARWVRTAITDALNQGESA